MPYKKKKVAKRTAKGQRCKALTAAGTRCKKAAVKRSPYCAVHATHAVHAVHAVHVKPTRRARRATRALPKRKYGGDRPARMFEESGPPAPVIPEERAPPPPRRAEFRPPPLRPPPPPVRVLAEANPQLAIVRSSGPVVGMIDDMEITAPIMDALKPGLRLGQKLGEGGMGTVYALCHDENNCPYVIKAVYLYSTTVRYPYNTEELRKQLADFDLEGTASYLASHVYDVAPMYHTHFVAEDVIQRTPGGSPIKSVVGFILSERYQGNMAGPNPAPPGAWEDLKERSWQMFSHNTHFLNVDGFHPANVLWKRLPDGSIKLAVGDWGDLVPVTDIHSDVAFWYGDHELFIPEDRADYFRLADFIFRLPSAN